MHGYGYLFSDDRAKQRSAFYVIMTGFVLVSYLSAMVSLHDPATEWTWKDALSPLEYAVQQAKETAQAFFSPE